MLQGLSTEARQLAEYMSELSEEASRAGWMQGLEFELWEAVAHGPRKYARLNVTQEIIDQLRRLSKTAGGWIVFDKQAGETLLDPAEWERRFAAWKERRRR